MIAALFVATGGCYFGLDGVDPWDESRDARLYAGPWPVVAHPPCARWGIMAEVAFGRRHGGVRGDDNGCFRAALAHVRRYGGVLEHPKSSSAWDTFGILRPPLSGAWVSAGDGIGWTACVEQGHYGHRTRKATWLYVAGVSSLPSLKWGPSRPEGYQPRTFKGVTFCAMNRRQRAATPPAFRDLLIAIATTARPAPATVKETT